MKRAVLLVAGAAGLFLALATPSCSGSNPNPCSASSCSGCCDSSGACKLAASSASCGLNGAACVSCTGTQVCSAGACTGSGGGAGGGSGASCAQTCNGCCDSTGACQTGSAVTACGVSGATCAACTGAQGCAAGACMNTGCTGCTASDGGCLTTLTDTACGNQGLTCVNCVAANGATCNTTSGACTGGTCGGCRNSLGVCQSGTTRANCGAGGFACSACGSNQVCTNGACVAGGTGGGAGGGAGGGTGGGTAGGAGGGAGGGTGGTGGSGGGFPTDVIPDPGTAMGAEWTDIEPNDRPSQAVPVGTMQTPWAGFSMPTTTISSPTDKDFFVFRTGNATQLMSTQLLLCWTGMFNLLDMYLYSVDGQMHQGPLVNSWTSTASGCETAFQSNGADAGLSPNTVYLLEVRPGPGLSATNTPTAYSA